ncbi:MAG: histidine triad nucleotide-binding protein [Clostridia bacterium]|nr:histidine triad nucleotide-binding protein [Clostridia bacterium]
MDNCVFCMIANGSIPASTVYEDDMVLAFCDIEPQAPTHVLVIPKAHVANVLEADEALMGRMLGVCAKVAGQLGVDGDGFRIVVNTGKFGNQSVQHLHMHVLGGRMMKWPPG